MTFYQELQLNQAGSKKLIHESKTTKEKIYHIAVFLFKIFITLAFCMGFVILYSMLFGSENSIVGVVILLCVMVFRNVDLGFKHSQALFIFLLFFVILAIGPRLANMMNPFGALLINLICIGSLVFFGCYNIMMFNHSTLVLGYLLLFGYDVSGTVYTNRLIAITISAIICGLIYYRNHHKKTYEKKLKDLFLDFNLSNTSTQWQITLIFGVCSILFITQLLGFPRVMWVGIAAMSILSPIKGDMKTRAIHRIPYNIIGGILCYIIYTFFPDSIFSNIGILGGIGVGLSATYGWQSLFNSFGAISVAAGIFGLPNAIFFRILDNVIGILYAILFAILFNKCFARFSSKA
ncbi:MAG: FUSC family protein [Cellulosilyticum sp.]|nr:FUSC family protein [Cellulosilyticum sp.]